MLVVAKTVRASLVRGSKAASDSQFSMSAGDNTPEDDNGTTSVASEIESEFIELRVFSSKTSWDEGGAVVSLEGEAPISSRVVYGGGWNRETMPLPQRLNALGACSGRWQW